MILRWMSFTKGLYKYNYTATSKSLHHQRHWLLKGRGHMRGFSKTSTEKASVWAVSENRAGPKANLNPVCSSGSVCILRTTLVEVLGLPPSKPKMFLHEILRYPTVRRKFLASGWPTEYEYMPYSDEYRLYFPFVWLYCQEFILSWLVNDQSTRFTCDNVQHKYSPNMGNSSMFCKPLLAAEQYFSQRTWKRLIMWIQTWYWPLGLWRQSLRACAKVKTAKFWECWLYTPTIITWLEISKEATEATARKTSGCFIEWLILII